MIVLQFQRKLAETQSHKEEENQDNGESETEQKKKNVLASGLGLGLVSSTAAENSDCLNGWGNDDTNDMLGENGEEEKVRRNNQVLATFFRPVQRQIIDIVNDVSPAVLLPQH